MLSLSQAVAVPGARSSRELHFSGDGARFSIAPDAGRFDDRPPFLDLGLLKRGKPFRRLLLARCDVEAELREARAHRRIGERRDRRGVKLGDDVRRRALGRVEAEPARNVEARQRRIRRRTECRASTRTVAATIPPAP